MDKQKRNKGPEKLTSILDETLDRMGLSAAISRSSVVQLWPEIVAPALTKHAQADRLTGSVLHVNVDSSVWMRELSSVRHILLEKINKSLHPDAKPITEIRFHQRSWAKGEQKKAPRSANKESRELSDPEKGFIRATLGPVTNPELRKILERLMEKDIQKKTDK